MKSDPPAVEHEDTGEFLVAPAPASPRPGSVRSRSARGEVLTTEAALAALVLAAEAERSAERVRSEARAGRRRLWQALSEARAGRRRLWQALLILAALGLAAMVLAATRLHPEGLP